MSMNGSSLVPTMTSVHQPVIDDREPQLRPKMFFMDRIKVLILLTIVLLLCTSEQKTQIPLMTWGEAFRDQLRAKWWIVILFGLEVIRQIHNLISEHSKGYHAFWQKKVFGGWERQMSKMKPYSRFRLSRLVKRLAVLSVIGLLLSWMWGIGPIQALAEAPARWFRNIFLNPAVGLPIGLTIALSTLGGLVYIVFFFGIFFIGGVETFKPGEIKTRFSDIWGQDHVVRRVKENLDFLEKPKEIEDRGGYVPSGILLWGPPGTGKTLMAEASAGETGKPYVFVDPSAFVQTFVGVAPMKIKFLYRKSLDRVVPLKEDALLAWCAGNEFGWSTADLKAAPPSFRRDNAHAVAYSVATNMAAYAHGGAFANGNYLTAGPQSVELFDVGKFEAWAKADEALRQAQMELPGAKPVNRLTDEASNKDLGAWK